MQLAIEFITNYLIFFKKRSWIKNDLSLSTLLPIKIMRTSVSDFYNSFILTARLIFVTDKVVLYLLSCNFHFFTSLWF